MPHIDFRQSGALTISLNIVQLKGVRAASRAKSFLERLARLKVVASSYLFLFLDIGYSLFLSSPFSV